MNLTQSTSPVKALPSLVTSKSHFYPSREKRTIIAPYLAERLTKLSPTMLVNENSGFLTGFYLSERYLVENFVKM